MASYSRDPLSELFDGGARRLLERAYARPGQWAGTRLAGPGPRHLAWLAARGINPAARDPVPGGKARTRWARAFVRALYYQHKWWSDAPGGGWRTVKRTTARHAGALEVQVGRSTTRGTAVRVRIRPGGQAALRAVKRMPDERRIYDDRGRPAGRWADPAGRDW